MDLYRGHDLSGAGNSEDGPWGGQSYFNPIRLQKLMLKRNQSKQDAFCVTRGRQVGSPLSPNGSLPLTSSLPYEEGPRAPLQQLSSLLYLKAPPVFFTKHPETSPIAYFGGCPCDSSIFYLYTTWKFTASFHMMDEES